MNEVELGRLEHQSSAVYHKLQRGLRSGSPMPRQGPHQQIVAPVLSRSLANDAAVTLVQLPKTLPHSIKLTTATN